MRDAHRQAFSRSTRTRCASLTPDVGGGFGTKSFNYREYPLVARRPRRCSAVRSNGSPTATSTFSPTRRAATTSRPPPSRSTATARILAMRVDIDRQHGRLLSQYGPFIPWGGVTMMTGLYDIQDGARRLPWRLHQQRSDRRLSRRRPPEAAYLVERLSTRRARVAGLSPERDPPPQLHPAGPDALPDARPADTYDTGEFAAHMDRALAAAGWEAFEDRLSESRAKRPPARPRLLHLHRGLRLPRFRAREGRARRGRHA